MRTLFTASTALAILMGLFGSSATASGAQAPDAQQVQEIVVTARRAGIPVWRVDGPKTTIFLVGAIDGVAKDTRWDPGALTDTLRKADRVMYPSTVGLKLSSPFQLFGLLMKARKMAALPKGQTLAGLMPPQQFQRLVALKNRGVLKAGFERKHPLAVAEDLRDYAKGKRGYGPGAMQFVEKAVRKHKIKSVPIRMMNAKPILNDFFKSPPQNYVPCLISAAALAEAGPGAVRARSDAWAQRRVPEALGSPAEKTSVACNPSSWGLIPRTDLKPQIRKLMQEPQLTVAVVSLGSLGQAGGVLDDLKAAGFDVQGPRWK